MFEGTSGGVTWPASRDCGSATVKPRSGARHEQDEAWSAADHCSSSYYSFCAPLPVVRLTRAEPFGDHSRCQSAMPASGRDSIYKPIGLQICRGYQVVMFCWSLQVLHRPNIQLNSNTRADRRAATAASRSGIPCSYGVRGELGGSGDKSMPVL